MDFSNFKAITSAEGERNAVYAIKWMEQNLSLTPEQACGFVGCWLAESQMNPQAFNRAEKAKKFKGSSANGEGYGAGIAQWSHGRKQDLMKLMGLKTPIETWSLEQQLQAVKLELTKGCKSKLISVIKQVNDVRSAVDVALRGYENGGNGALASVDAINKYTWCGGYSGSMATRTKYAELAMNKYKAEKNKGA